MSLPPQTGARTEEDSLSASSCGSDTEMKLKKTSEKLPKSPKSPYSSSTCLHPKKAGLLKAAESKHLDSSLGKESWQLRPGPHKQGAWVGQTKSDIVIRRAESASSSTPEYLKEALGMKKPKHSRFSSSGYIPGTPVYKEKEDMYDEIIELKKKIQAQKCEADQMKTKLRRLEEENKRKDKQIDQLLEYSKSCELPWARTEQKNDISAVISGLKQKVLRLEQQCKEKNNCINQLQSVANSMNAEEMRKEITLQSYYEEIQRLQILLARSKTVQRTSPPKSQEQKVLSAAVLQLSRSIRELQEENQKLKADLDQALAGSLGCSRANHCAEKGRQRPLRRSSKLRKKTDENVRLQVSETSTSSLLSASPLAPLDHPASGNPPKEQEHLRREMKELKGHMAVLQKQLAVKEEEIWKLTLNVKELEEEQNTRGRQARVEAAEPSDQGQQELHVGARQFHPSCTFTSRGSDSGHSPPHPPEHLRREQAAQIIQRKWKAYKAKIEEDSLNKVAVALQAVFRGHLSRQRLLAGDAHGQNSPSILNPGKKNSDLSPGPSSSPVPADCRAEEEAVGLIQSVFRAHITRAQLAESPQICSPEEEKTSPAASEGEKKPVWSIFKPVPLVFTSTVPATSSQDQRPPSPLPCAAETHSDDSDDIITVSSSPSVREKSPFDFSSYLSHSLLHS